MNRDWIFIGKDTLDKNKFNMVKNQMFVKPLGGLWLSPYTKDKKYISTWHDFLVNDLEKDIDGMKGTIVEIKDDARILIIDDLNDLIKLADKYTLESDLMPKSFMTFLDFEKISKDYDVIILTEEGQYRTRLTTPNLYGWDFECMLVFNYDILEIKSVIEITK